MTKGDLIQYKRSNGEIDVYIVQAVTPHGIRVEMDDIYAGTANGRIVMIPAEEVGSCVVLGHVG